MAKSTIMIPFFFTIPISRITPIKAMTEKSIPATFKIRKAPTPADGKVERIVNGWT